jgi:rsbT co-antagonist protein RsbR
MNQIFASTLPTSASAAETAEIDKLLAYFNIQEVDRKALRRLHEHTTPHADDIVDSFYEHVLGQEMSAGHFADEQTLDRVKQAQKRYFGQLMAKDVDVNYMEERRRIGRIHERVGITPTLYLGSYAYYLDRVAMTMVDKLQEDPVPVLRMVLALMKMSQFDMALALETYVEKREATIRERERELQELATPVLLLQEGLLLVPVVGSLDEMRARRLTIDLLEGIREHQARVVVLDITGVTEADSAVTNHLIQCMDAAELMGVTPVLTGISVDVAQSLVKIGLSRENVRTAGDLKRGLEFASALLGG